MATTTSAIPAGADNPGRYKKKYTRIVGIIRNMINCKRSEDRKVVVPVRTTSNPSPAKKAASNRHPGQSHTRTEVGDALNHELATARYLMHDLADHVLGHIVSTELARDILQQFVKQKVVQVFEEAGSLRKKVPLDAESDDVKSAVREAFEIADYYDCIRLDSQGKGSESGRSSTGTKEKGKGKERAKTYSFEWISFPGEPLRDDDLVAFLNDITDRAFAFAKPKLVASNPELRHRFATPKDKHHAVPLSYEPDGEDMRPDFLLLPIEAFSDDFKTVDPKYVNFTASRLVGESKNKDLAAGVEQLERYARGLRRAQPWVHYVLGLTVTKDKAVLIRGEGSGTERLELMLSDGRGCIEFIRIVLGLALADQVDLGHNPAVVLDGKKQACKAKNVTRRSTARPQYQAFSVPDPVSRLKSEIRSVAQPHSDPAAFGAHVESSSSTKRAYSDVGDNYEGTKPPKKRRTDKGAIEDVERFIFYPVAVYDHKCLGILFTASSIRGRGTTVFCVVDLNDDKKLLALKMSWQDLARVAEQDAVMEHLKNQGNHSNLIVPLKIYKVEKDGELLTTLGAIRGFLDEQIEGLGVENRVLTISVSDLKRPVKYFWGVHDFVRGLRGALLGHQYLTKIGILHRDISENNIVLGLRPDDERGYLIDLDMAILQDAEPHAQAETIVPFDPLTDSDLDSFFECTSQTSSNESCLLQPGDRTRIKALRTGTFPYMSYNVLLGGRHTHFDDVESFLYVLFLFFFSYAGPLSVSELRQADEAGFVQPVGSGRLSHMKNWPARYANWADGNAEEVGCKKHYAISSFSCITRDIHSSEFKGCLENNWPAELHLPISRLIEASFKIFCTSMPRTITSYSRTEADHTAFIRVVDRWLAKYSHLENKYSNCPFDQVCETKST